MFLQISALYETDEFISCFDTESPDFIIKFLFDDYDVYDLFEECVRKYNVIDWDLNGSDDIFQDSIPNIASLYDSQDRAPILNKTYGVEQGCVDFQYVSKPLGCSAEIKYVFNGWWINEKMSLNKPVNVLYCRPKPIRFERSLQIDL